MPPVCMADLRLALRSLVRNPAATFSMAGALAVAVWANVLVWAVVLPAAIDPLPYPDAGRIVRVWQAKVTSPTDRVNAAYGNFLLWRERSRVAVHVGAYGVPVEGMLLEAAQPGEFESVRDVGATEGFFEVLGVEPVLGRLFNADERQSGRRVLVISHAYWMRRFGGDAAVIGRSLAQAGSQRSVIAGVMPPGFEYPPGAEAWFPAYLPKAAIRDQNSRDIGIIARLAPGATTAAFRDELLRLRSEAAREFPATDVSWTPVVAPLRDELLGDVRPALVSLHLVVVLLAVLGFANVLTLMLVRADGRRAQHAIQLALGATRGGPRRQLVIEGVIVAAAGWVAAIAAARATIGLIVSWLPSSLPQLGAITLQGRLLFLSLSVSLAAGIAWGLLTALHVERSGLVETLSMRSHEHGVVSGRRWRQAAVVCGVSIAVVIVAAALVASAEVRRLYRADPGFGAEQVVAARVSVTVARLSEIERALPARLTKAELMVERSYLLPSVIFVQDLLAQAHDIAGVKLAAVSSGTPLSGPSLSIVVSRAESAAGGVPGSGEVVSAYLVQVTEDYFRLLEVPLLAGRSFNAGDRLGAEPVAIVSHTLARRLWGDQPAIGRLLRRRGESSAVRVVGIVADVALSRPGDPPVAMLYRPFAQSPSASIRLLTDSHFGGAQLRPALAEAARRLGAHLTDTEDLPDIVERSMRPAASAARALCMLALIAVVLAFVGLHATLAAALHFRQREFGIRVAMGASPSRISALVLKHVLAQTVLGLGIGLAAVLGLAATLSASVQLPSVDTPALVITVLVVLAAALVACARPLTRASRVNPTVLLR